MDSEHRWDLPLARRVDVGARMVVLGLHADDAEMATTIASEYSIEMQDASDSVEAVAGLRHHPRVLLLLGARTPDVAPSIICRAVRSELTLRHASLLVLQDGDDQSDLDRLRAAGANIVLGKHRDVSALDLAIARLINVAPRVSASVRVYLRIGPDKVDCHAHTKNISTSGMLLELDKPVAVGDRYSLYFEITLDEQSGAAEICTESEVVRIVGQADNRSICGVRYLNLAAGDYHRLDEYISHQQKAAQPATD